MVIAYPPQIVNFIDISVGVIKGQILDRNVVRAPVKEVKAFDLELRNDLDRVRALNLMDEKLVMEMTLLGGYIFKRDQVLQKFEVYINNKNMLFEILREFCEIAQIMQVKTRFLSEQLRIIAPYEKFPVIDGLKDFYAQELGEVHIDDADVSELKRTLKGVLLGVIPITDLDAKFTNLYNKQDALIERLQTFSSDTDISALKVELEQQRQTLLELKDYFMDKNKDRLTKAMEELDKTANCLEKINNAISVKETSDQFVTCFRCGEENAFDSQFCKKCRAALVVYKTPEEEKQEEENKEEAPQVRMCFRCGQLNAPDFQFCRRCKTPLIIDKSLDG